MHLSKSIGVLLLNLGTPNSCEVQDVKAYLKQFLNDQRVIELPSLMRWMLVNFLIVPFRANKSAAAYAKIWQPDGSPLLLNSVLLKDKLAKSLGDKYVVSLGMSYGTPSIHSALHELKMSAVKKIIILPLFPQYSSAATGSPLEKVLQIISKYKVIPDIEVKSAYYQNSQFIDALASVVQPYINVEFDYLLMSYHGLPVRQMVHCSKSFNCDLLNPCPELDDSNVNCYRAQCYKTSRLLASSLKVPSAKWGVGFQSRLGKTPWIKPYTDELLVKLRQQGVKKLVVCCPSFVTDCLETIEEIGIVATRQWLDLGGESLHLVPCLNARDRWIDALVGMIDVNM